MRDLFQGKCFRIVLLHADRFDFDGFEFRAG